VDAKVRPVTESEGAQVARVFAFTLYDEYFQQTQARVAAIKKAHPQAIIIIGGPSVNTAHDLKALATAFFPEATALVKGDGEVVITELIKALTTEPPDYLAIQRQKGVYVKIGDFEYCDERRNIATLSQIQTFPFPVDRETAGILSEDIETWGHIFLHTINGCVHHCKFCSHQYHRRGEIIYWSAERILTQLCLINQLVEKGKLPAAARCVVFTEDNFFQDRNRAKEFLRGVIDQPDLSRDFEFRFNATVSAFYEGRALDQELLDLLNHIHGSVCIGTDGFHPAALKFHRKGHSWEQAKALMAELKTRGIEQTHWAILLHPEIKARMLLATIDNLIRCLLDYGIFLQTNIELIAHENTPLADLAEEKKLIIGRDGQHIKQLPSRVALRDADLRRFLDQVLQIPIDEFRLVAEVMGIEALQEAIANLYNEAGGDVGEHPKLRDAIQNRHRPHTPLLLLGALLNIFLMEAGAINQLREEYCRLTGKNLDFYARISELSATSSLVADAFSLWIV
jgi:hypothetical protein